MLVYASGQCMEQRSCGCSQLWHSAPPGMAVGCCELRLRSTPRYRLVCICFPTPGRGLPYGSGLGLSRCLGPGECLHSFIQAIDQLKMNNCRPWFISCSCATTPHVSFSIMVTPFHYFPSLNPRTCRSRVAQPHCCRLVLNSVVNNNNNKSLSLFRCYRYLC